MANSKMVMLKHSELEFLKQRMQGLSGKRAEVIVHKIARAMRTPTVTGSKSKQSTKPWTWNAKPKQF